MAKRDTGFIGSGTMRISIFSTVLNEWLGWTKVGNVELYELTPDTEEIPRISYQEGTAGQALETVYIAKPTKVKYKFNTMTAANIAVALAASLMLDVSVVAGTVTSEAHTAWRNQELRLTKRNVKSLVLSTPTAGTGALYTTDTAGYAIGVTEINIITGTGTVLSGDTVTFAGDTNLYAVKTGATAAGKIVLYTGLKKAIPSSATAMTIRAAITALSATTDYTQDALNSHFVDVLSTGVIADGGSVLAAYSYSSSTSDEMLSGVSSFIARTEINGINEGDKKHYTIYNGNNTFTSKGGFSFLGKAEFASAEIEGIANIDLDPTSPCYNHAYKGWFNEVVTA